MKRRWFDTPWRPMPGGGGGGTGGVATKHPSDSLTSELFILIYTWKKWRLPSLFWFVHELLLFNRRLKA